jgi:hypothetical protein
MRGEERVRIRLMKKLLLLVAIGVTSLTFGSAVQAQGIRIELGDRPFYRHGPRYWSGEYEMIWVPGHWSNHRQHWIHGHYVRGEHRRHDFDRRFEDRREDDRRDDRRNDFRDDNRR